MCSDKAAIIYGSDIRKTRATKENTSYHDNEFPEENLWVLYPLPWMGQRFSEHITAWVLERSWIDRAQWEKNIEDSSYSTIVHLGIPLVKLRCTEEKKENVRTGKIPPGSSPV